MIAKIAKIFAFVGAGLMLICGIIFSVGAMTWGVNGVVLTAGIGVVVLIVGAVAVVWIAGAVEGLFIRFLLVWQSIRRINAETAKQEFAADYYQVNHPTAGAMAVDRTGRYFVLQPPIPTPPGAGKIDQGKEPDPEPEEPDPEPLLPVINTFSRLLIIGGMGCGKSELLKWLADDRVKKGHVVVCDSHAAPDTWPTYCQISGIGRNYPEIEATINWICAELDNRYKQRATGEKKHFDQITLIIDELFVLHQFLNLGPQFKSLLAESRKVDIGLIMAGQSDRANALGLSGNKDLIAGFEAVVYLDRDDAGRYVAEVKTGRHSKHCIHPGPYRGRGGSSGPGASRPAWGASPGAGAGVTSGGHEAGTAYHRESEPEPEPVISGWIGHTPEPDMTDNRAQIWKALYRAADSLTAREIERLTGLSGGYIRKALTRMERAGQIIKERRGRYRLASM